MYNSPKTFYVIYDKNKHEYCKGRSLSRYCPCCEFGFFKDCDLYDSVEEATKDVNYSNKFERRDLQILELVIYKWSCKEILDV